MEKETTQNQPEIFKSKKWLQKLKDESWEAELLVSAIAIFGTFQLFKVVDWSTNKFIDLLTHDTERRAILLIKHIVQVN